MKASSKLLFLFLFFILTSNFTCDEPCIGPQNEFTFDISVEPSARVIEQLDTLWYSTSFEALVNLQNREGTLDVSNASCVLIMKVLKIDPGTNLVTEGVNQFDIINDQGALSRDIFDPDNPIDPCTAVLDFTCSDMDCTFRIGFAPKEPGIYAIFSGVGECNRIQNESECLESNEMRDLRFTNQDLHQDVLNELDIRELSVQINNGTTSTLIAENNESLYVFEVE